MPTELTKAMVALSPPDRQMVRSMVVDECRYGYSPDHLLSRLANDIQHVRRSRQQRAATPADAESTAFERLVEKRTAVFHAAMKRAGIGSRDWFDNDPEVFVTRDCDRVGWRVHRVHVHGHQSPRDQHQIRVKRGWLCLIAAIGDGTGVVDGRYVILDAELVVADALSQRAFWRARLARKGRGFSVAIEDKVLSGWPGGVVTVHKNVRMAMREKPPAIVLEREAAAKAAWDANRVTDPDDLAALESIDW